MVERVSKVAQRYAARSIAVDERFDVHPNDVRILVALGRIQPEKGDHGYVAPAAAPAEDKSQYQTKVLTSAPAEPRKTKAAPSQKRQGKRKAA